MAKAEARARANEGAMAMTNAGARANAGASALTIPLARSVLCGVAVLCAGCMTVRPILVLPARDARPARATLFMQVRVFTGLTDGLTEPLDVLVAGGRIAALGAPGSLTVPEELERVDGAGKTLLPGLIDSHVHLGGGDGTPPWDSQRPNVDAQAAALVYSGVTTILAAGRDTDPRELRERIAKGELAGPRVFSSSRQLTAPGGHPVGLFKAILPWPIDRAIISQRARQVGTAEEAREAVRSELADGPDFLKVMYDSIPPGAPQLSGDTLRALVAEARLRHARVIVHVGKPADALEAAEAGAALLMHTPFDGRLSDAQVARLRELDVPLVTTARIPEALREALSGHPTLSPLEREVMPPGLPAAFARIPAGYQVPGFPGNYAELLPTQGANLDANLRALDAAGVTLLVGTDSGLPMVLHGAAVHRELQKLVSLGIPAGRVLRMATSAPARFLAREPDFGTIEPGKRADLLLVRGDPVADIRATEDLEGVWQDGRRLERRRPGK